MKWPWKRPIVDGGERALEETKAKADDAEAQWPIVQRLADELREHRQFNHFVQKIENLLRGSL